MFGKDDNDTSKVNPENDGVLDSPTTQDDSASPAYIPTPAPNDMKRTSAPLPATATDSEDLLGIKQAALKLLTPLVGHLNQTPEEKFRTTMMMIQASDDQSLIKDAYAAAQSITDEKTKAQALLDIINEINYFTQQHS